MKIRNGFVSNSSSSSFCIIGMPFDDDDLKKYIAKIENITDEDEIYNIDIIDYFYGKNKDIDIERGIGEYYEQHILGKYYSAMKDDETKAQFESRVKKLLEDTLPDIGGEIKVALHYDGGYEG